MESEAWIVSERKDIFVQAWHICRTNCDWGIYPGQMWLLIKAIESESRLFLNVKTYLSTFGYIFPTNYDWLICLGQVRLLAIPVQKDTFVRNITEMRLWQENNWYNSRFKTRNLHPRKHILSKKGLRNTLYEVCAVHAQGCRTKSFPQSVLGTLGLYCTYLIQGQEWQEEILNSRPIVFNR